MVRALFLIAALGLTGCAGSTPADGGNSNNPPAFALAHDLNCNAGDMRECPPGGCTAANPGEQSTLYISLSVPRAGGEGGFCIATGCETATYEPKQSSTPGWSATMRTNDRTQYAADLHISTDLRRFTLQEGGPEGINIWNGECSAAGS